MLDQEEFASYFIQSPWLYTLLKVETPVFFGEG